MRTGSEWKEELRSVGKDVEKWKENTEKGSGVEEEE